MKYKKLKYIATYPTGKLNSNAAVEDGPYPFFTCAHEVYRIDRYAYDGEYVLLGGNNATGDFPIFYYTGKFEAYQRTYLIQPIDATKYDTHYLYYAIGLKLAMMKGNASGTATKFLTQPILNNLSIEDWNIDYQKRIVAVLERYDDLIDCNKKRIQVLEGTVERLYKEWFVRFKFNGHKDVEFHEEDPRGWAIGSKGMLIPNGWHFGELKEIGSFVRGKNITAAQMIEGDIPVISAGIEPSGYHNESNVSGNSLTISASGANAGYLKYHLSDIWAADCSYYQNENNLWFVLSSLKFLQPVISNLQCGAAQPHVYPKNINRLSIIIPPQNIIEEFCKKVSPFFDEIRMLNNKNTILKKQRDLLLPRIMDGRVKV